MAKIKKVRELWKKVPGFDGVYASSHGRVSLEAGYILPISIQGRYAFVSIDGKQRQVGHLVTAAWRGRRPRGMIVRHLNDCGTDNRIINLQYGTQLQNAQDRIRNERYAREAGLPVSKREHMTRAEIERARERYAAGEVTKVQLANELERSYETIRKMLTGETHRDAPGPLSEK